MSTYDIYLSRDYYQNLNTLFLRRTPNSCNKFNNIHHTNFKKIARFFFIIIVLIALLHNLKYELI